MAPSLLRGINSGSVGPVFPRAASLRLCRAAPTGLFRSSRSSNIVNRARGGKGPTEEAVAEVTLNTCGSNKKLVVSESLLPGVGVPPAQSTFPGFYVLLAVATVAVVSVTLKAGYKFLWVVSAANKMTQSFSLAKLGVALQYHMLQGRNTPTLGKLWTLIAFGGFIVFQGAWAYKSAVVGTEWPEALQKSYFTLNNVPGMDCTSEENPRGTLVLNCIHVFSLFTFAILVGIMTDDISRAVEYLRTGNFNVVEADHTVVIGWNKQTVHTIRHILQRIDNPRIGDAHVFSKPLLLLADMNKEEMDAELLEAFGEDLLGRVIMSRQGKCQDFSNMERVSVAQARTVVWMHPDDDAVDEADGGGGGGVPWSTKLAASLAMVESMGRGLVVPQNLVLQSRCTNDEWESDVGVKRLLANMKDGLHGRKYNVTRVSDMWGLTEILAQCASQPGLTDVFERLFIREEKVNPEVHVLNFKQMKGWTFAEARRSFPGSTAVVGLASVGMNPADDVVLGEDESIILLSMDPKRSLKPLSVPRANIPLPPAGRHVREVRKRHYVLVSHCGAHHTLLDSLIETLGQESNTLVTISVITRDEPSEEEAAAHAEGIPVKYITGDPNSAQCLVDAGVDHADSVVIDLMPDFPPDEADAQVLATVLQLQALLSASANKERSKRLTVICGINHPQSRVVLEGLEGGDVAGVGGLLHIDCIEHDKLLGGILTQVAASPQLEAVFEDLFDADGNEVYAKPCEFYGLLSEENKSGGAMQWSYIQEVVRKEGDLLVGLVDRSENVRLAVPYSESVTLHDGDRLVVISEDLY